MMKKLIIGLGTGRCGSLSLSYFLSNQPGMKVLHEGTIYQKKHIIKWEKDHENLLEWIDKLENISDNNQYFGDIGMYFLPYVSFIISRFPNVRFICLKRKREQVVKSFLKWSSSVNHWYEHDGTTWDKDAMMDSAFPKFNEPDKAKAIGLYWDMYYEEIDRLIATYPQNISCFSIESLNSISGRNEILDFVEYRGERKLNGDYIKHKNTGINYLSKCCLHWAVWSGQRTLPKPVRHWLWTICGRHLYYLISDISGV